MKRRTLVIAGLVVVALIGGALFASSYFSNDQREQRAWGELGQLSFVESADQEDRRIALDRDVDSADIDEVMRLLAEGSDSDEHYTSVTLGGISTHSEDLEAVWESMVAASERSYDEADRMSVRDLGGKVRIESILGDAAANGGVEPDAQQGAEKVLKVLASLRENGVPDNLHLVAAERQKNTMLVMVLREALGDIDATSDALRDLARTDPDDQIICDRQGCRVEQMYLDDDATE